MFGLEQEIRTQIIGEQSHKFKLQKDELDTQIEKMNDYKEHVSQIVNKDFAADYDTTVQMLKKWTEKACDINPETSLYKPPLLYPGTGTSKYAKAGSITANAVGDQPYNGAGTGMPGVNMGRLVSPELQVVGTMPGGVVPKNFQHYSHCSCFVPNPKYPNYTMESAEINMLSEQKARFELARVCEVMRKQRLFWRFKEMLAK